MKELCIIFLVLYLLYFIYIFIKTGKIDKSKKK